MGWTRILLEAAKRASSSISPNQSTWALWKPRSRGQPIQVAPNNREARADRSACATVPRGEKREAGTLRRRKSGQFLPVDILRIVGIVSTPPLAPHEAIARTV